MSFIKANGEYDTKKVKTYLEELRALMERKPKVELDNSSTHLIINNLIEGFGYAIDTIAFIKEELRLERSSLLSKGSDAKN